MEEVEKESQDGGEGESSDGERGQHSSETSGVLVDGDELWPLVHFKSVSVKLTPENSFFYYIGPETFFF